MGYYFNELRWKIIRTNNLLQFIHQITIEIRFRKSLAQERFKSNLEFRNQIIVSSMKFWKSFAKFMIFGTTFDDHFSFKMDESKISICKEFKYLVVVFTKRWSFCKARKHNYDLAKKATHLLYKRINNLNLSIDLQLQFFEHTILPIALYGCAIWAFENAHIIEKLQMESSSGTLQIQRNLLQHICYMQN